MITLICYITCFVITLISVIIAQPLSQWLVPLWIFVAILERASKVLNIRFERIEFEDDEEEEEDGEA